MNHVTLMGRLARDAETKETSTGKTVARMTIAVDRWSKKDGDGPKADFISLIAWDKLATFAGKYLKKGVKIVVEGRLQVRSYEKDGEKKYATDVVVHNIEFAESRKSSGGSGGSEFGTEDAGDIPF